MLRILMNPHLPRGASARSFVALACAGLLGALGGASCSSEVARPAELGNCEAQPDGVTCSVTPSAIGAMAPTPETSPVSEDDFDAGFDDAQCGSVVGAFIISSAEPTCLA